MIDEPEAPPAWWTRARAEHESRLVVGARVRVRLSAECEFCRPKVDCQEHSDEMIRWLESPDGSLSTVIAVPYGFSSERAAGHTIVVDYDHPIRVDIALCGQTWSHGGVYAATELELLDPTPPE